MVYRKLINPTTTPIIGDRDELSMPLMLDDMKNDIFRLTLFYLSFKPVSLDTTWHDVFVLPN